MKLIPMTDFCLNLLNENPPYDEVKMLTKISNYANFLKQPITLKMFAVTDESERILEEPERIHFSTEFDYKAELGVYNEAKGSVFFDCFTDFEVGENMFETTYKDSDGEERFWISKNELVEDLLGFDFEFELNTNAINQLGLSV